LGQCYRASPLIGSHRRSPSRTPSPNSPTPTANGGAAFRSMPIATASARVSINPEGENPGFFFSLKNLRCGRPLGMSACRCDSSGTLDHLGLATFHDPNESISGYGTVLWVSQSVKRLVDIRKKASPMPAGTPPSKASTLWPRSTSYEYDAAETNSRSAPQQRRPRLHLRTALVARRLLHRDQPQQAFTLSMATTKPA